MVGSRQVNSSHASEDISELIQGRGNDEPIGLTYICDESERNFDVLKPGAGKSNFYFAYILLCRPE